METQRINPLPPAYRAHEVQRQKHRAGPGFEEALESGEGGSQQREPAATGEREDSPEVRGRAPRAVDGDRGQHIDIVV